MEDYDNKKLKKEIKIDYLVNKISLKQELLLKSLLNFYNNKKNLEIIVPIIKQNTVISLRLLDWLVTNYSKKNNICYSLIQNSDINKYIPSNKHFNLWMDYKNQLKAYSKKQFDPFCRRERIILNIETLEIIIGFDQTYINNDKYIITTVGQLNFFRWAILNKVLDYAFENRKLIEKDMLILSDKKFKNKDTKRQLSKNNHSAKSHELKILIEF